MTSSERLAEIQARRERNIEPGLDAVPGDDVDWLIAEIDRLREIVNSQKTKPEYRAVQRKARNDRHRADFLQRKADRLAHDLAEANAALSAAEARVETLQRQVEAARTEWGVRLTWPSGETADQKRDSQGDARQVADWHNTSGCSVCTAELITRTVAVSDWSLAAAVPGKPQPTQPEGDQR